MKKAALVALPQFSIKHLAGLLQDLTDQDWRIRTLALDGRVVTTAEGIRVAADASLTDTVPLGFQLMVLPGGRYGAEVWNDIRLHRFLRQYDGQRHWFAAAQEGIICLAAAGLLGGVMYSLDEDVANHYSDVLAHAIYRSDAVTVDANVISSNGSAPVEWADTVRERMVLNL